MILSLYFSWLYQEAFEICRLVFFTRENCREPAKLEARQIVILSDIWLPSDTQKKEEQQKSDRTTGERERGPGGVLGEKRERERGGSWVARNDREM